MARFETNTPIDSAIKQMASKVHHSTLMTGLTCVPKPMLVGWVSKDEVNVFWVRPLCGNIFRPHFKGQFTRIADKTVLEGEFSMGTFAKTILFIFFGILGMVEIAIVYVRSSQQDLQPIAIIIPLLIGLCALFLLWCGRCLGKGDIDRILNEIQTLIP
jgi:hypothetical protein